MYILVVHTLVNTMEIPHFMQTKANVPYRFLTQRNRHTASVFCCYSRRKYLICNLFGIEYIFNIIDLCTEIAVIDVFRLLFNVSLTLYTARVHRI